MPIHIKEIPNSDKAARRKFVKFPIRMYKDSPYYVPSLVLDEMSTLDEEKNPAFDYCEMQMFLAYKEGEIVGRIAAIINHSANKIWNRQSARFNYADFIDDKKVVDALFDAAITWSKKKGMTSIIGPMGFTDLDLGGLLIDGYEEVSTMAAEYNYSYYKEHIERLGFEKEVDWNEYRIPVPVVVPARHQRIANLVKERYGLKVLKFKGSKEVRPYIGKVFKLLNEAYAPLYGFAPLTEKQIKHYVDMYVPLLNWDLVPIIIKEETDEVVGFGVAMPSVSRGLIKSRGKLFPFGWAHLLKDLKGKNEVVDLMLIGIAPEYQGKGVNAIVFTEIIPAAHNNGFKYAESNPELELNEKMVSLWDGFDAINHKKRRAYIKHI